MAVVRLGPGAVGGLGGRQVDPAAGGVGGPLMRETRVVGGDDRDAADAALLEYLGAMRRPKLPLPAAGVVVGEAVARPSWLKTVGPASCGQVPSGRVGRC